jgi:hypothetical protein
MSVEERDTEMVEGGFVRIRRENIVFRGPKFGQKTRQLKRSSAGVGSARLRRNKHWSW